MSSFNCELGLDWISFTMKIVPGSSKTSIEGTLDDMIKMKVAAAPEKGKANKEIVAFLSKKLGIKKKDIEILSGHTSPVKKVKIAGIGRDDLEDLIRL